MHGYLQKQKQIDNDDSIDPFEKATNSWLQLRFSSHVEGYLMAIQEQELDAKETRKRRKKDEEKKRRMDKKCRACHENEESVFHLVCSCPNSSSDTLP